MRDLLRHRDFRLLLAGQTATVFGDWTLLLVFGIWGKSLTGSNAVAGLMIFAMAAPGLLGPLGGVVADRMPRRRLIIAVDLASVPVVLSLWGVHDRGELWLLFAVAVWYGLTTIIVAAAMSGLVQSMLPPDLVGPANGALTTVRQGLRLVGPLVGAGLYTAVGGPWVATIDAVTFVIGAMALVALRHPEQRVVRVPVRFREEVAAGITHLVGSPVLRRLALCEIGVVAAFGVTEPVVYALLDGLHRPAAFLGVLVAVQGIGAIVGGVLATGLVNRVGDARLFVAGLVLLGAGVALETVPSLGTAFVGFLLFGCGLPALQVAAATMLQHRTPNAVMGRTAAAFEVISSVPYTASIGLGALVVGIVDYRLVFGVVAAVLAVAGVYAAVALVPRAVTTTTDPDPVSSLQ